MPEPPGLVVKNGTKRLVVFDSPGPSSSTQMSTPMARSAPADADAGCAADFEARVGGVPNQVDEELLDLIGVDGDREVGTGLDLNRDAGFEPGNLHQQRLEHDRRRASAPAGARGANRLR